MGAGSILLSGSSLVTSVPPGRLFGGVPATDQKAATRPLSADELFARARETAVEFARQLGLRGFDVRTAPLVTGGDEGLELLVRHEGRVHRLALARALDGSESSGDASEEVLVALDVDEDAWGALGPERVAIDLAVPRIRGAAGPLADAWREFLRKRGVRLRPRSWTYRGGWL
jgi:hypothetical protein